MKKWVAIGVSTLVLLALLLTLATIGDWSGVVALFAGIAWGATNAGEIKEFFR